MPGQNRISEDILSFPKLSVLTVNVHSRLTSPSQKVCKKACNVGGPV